MTLIVFLLLLVQFANPRASGARESDEAKLINLSLGSIEFEAPVNIKALTIHGKADQLKGSLRMDGLNLTQILVTVPVNSLSTGIKVRDKHMRERVFKSEDGKFPDIEFFCPEVTGTGQTDAMECEVKGYLKIRGLRSEVSVALRVTYEGGKYRAKGETVIKLTDYGIDPPKQFGIKLQNHIRIKFEVFGNE